MFNGIRQREPCDFVANTATTTVAEVADVKNIEDNNCHLASCKWCKEEMKKVLEHLMEEVRKDKLVSNTHETADDNSTPKANSKEVEVFLNGEKMVEEGVEDDALAKSRYKKLKRQASKTWSRVGQRLTSRRKDDEI